MLRPVIARKYNFTIGIFVQELEVVTAIPRLTLWPTRAECLGQRRPHRIHAPATHLEPSADARRLVPAEIVIRFGRIVITAVVPLQHVQRNQRVKQVAGAARVDTDALAQGVRVKRTVRQFRKDPQFRSAQRTLAAQNP